MAKLNAAKPDAGIALTAQVEREIGAVARKIRTNDLFTGAAMLVVGTLAYAVSAVMLDKWLTLPAWVRQLEFVGFLTTLLGLAYFNLVRPLMRTVNPRYVARQVEGTMPESKNELINWVDLREQDMAGSVKSALADRAAAGFGDADVESAVRSRKFLWLGGTAALLVAVLAVLFLVFKGTQFGSLLGRAFNPFQSGAIAARTTIDLLEPADPDATVADGEQIRFAVRLVGRVPDPAAPDKVRLKVRYHADAKETEEIAFAKTDTLRDFELILTRGTIQNGFWYTVAAGDAETAEHRITVRTKPMVKGFAVDYEYPAYLRIAPSSNTDPKLRGYPGTKVRLQVQTNREVKAGTMAIEPRGEAVEGKVFGEKNDSLRFVKTLDRAGQYRVAFASTAGEPSGSSIPYPIEILPDNPPALTIEKPATDEITLPINGLLEVDATVADDFGIEHTTLQFGVAGAPKIAGKKYLGAASFRREKDGTFPTRVDYKDSVKLDQLKDEAGKPVPLQAGQVLEFWLEAKDNCTVLPHELGKSKKVRVNLVAPPAKPEETKQQEQRKQERQQQDAQHQQQEKDKQANEPRPAPPDPNQKGETGEKAKGENGEQPMDPSGSKAEGGMGQPDPSMNPEPMTDPKDVQRKAEEIQNKIDEKNHQGGEAKPNPNAEKPEGAEEPKAGERKAGEAPPMNGAANSEPKAGEDPATDPKAPPAGENKEAGKVQPSETSQPKPEPNQKAGDETRPEAQPTGDGAKTAPKAEDKPAEEKPPTAGAPPKDQPKPGEKPKDDEAAGGKNEQPQDGAKPMPGGTDGPAPNKSEGKPESGKAKRDGQPKPGEEKEAPKAGPGDGEKPQPEERPADGKGQKPAEAGGRKPEPKDKSAPDAGGEKPAPKAGTEPMKPGDEASDAKGEGAKPPEAKPMDPKSGAADKNAKGEEKPVPQSGEKKGKPSPGGSGDKPDQKQIENAVKDLDSEDPAKKKAAQDQLDKSIGKENREKAEQTMKDLKSDNPNTREDARKKLDEMAKEASQKSDDQAKKPSKEELEKLANDAQDLNSPDAEKRKEAEEKLDKSVGKENREKLQQEMKSREAADRKKLEDAAKQQAGKTPGAPPKEPTKEELDKLAKDAKDLNSTDPDKKKAAEKKLDEAVGKENREKLQRDMDGRAGEDRKKLQEDADRLARDKPKPAPAKPKAPTKEEIERLAKDAKDLNSADADKKKAAEEKFDKAVGQDARKQIQKDMKERDAAAGEAEKKKVEEAAKKAAKEKADKTPGAKPKEPTKEEVEQLGKDAKNLDSPDAEQRKAAEDKLDGVLGKEAREQLQKNMKDLKGDDPQKAQEARDRLEKLAKDWQPGNGSKGQDGKPLEENPANRLKSAELQLDEFKNYRGDKKFLKDNGMTDADYERFLKGYEEMVDRQRKEVDDAKLNPVQARPQGPGTIGANDASNTRVKGGTEAGIAPAAAGPSFAPPGFSEAQRDFAKEAREALETKKKK